MESNRLAELVELLIKYLFGLILIQFDLNNFFDFVKISIFKILGLMFFFLTLPHEKMFFISLLSNSIFFVKLLTFIFLYFFNN